MGAPATEATQLRRSGDAPDAYVQILAAGGRRIPAHSSVLMSASPVLESMLEGARKGGEEESVIIRIHGVHHEAVEDFVRLLYDAGRCSAPAAEAEIGEHGVHLLVLAHVYQVAWLKRACELTLASQLEAEAAVDLLVLARLCDAPRLRLSCMKLIADDFEAVKRSEGWRFLQANDPFLELDILQSLQDAHSRQKRGRRRREQQRLYTELSEAMECLQHMCTEGCAAGRCPNPATCRGLQRLVGHLAACDRKRKLHGCPRCKRLWQLLRLHASICDQGERCKVPLCSQFKQRKMVEKDDERWSLLANKVSSARVMSNLAKRKRPAESIIHHPTFD